MSKEKGASYYDRAFGESDSYQGCYKESHYYHQWAYIVQKVRKVASPKILEIGCGTGQLAHYLYDEGFRDYRGFDFSPKAIELARQRVPMSFAQADALDPRSYSQDYNVAIVTEVLEHIDRDREVLENVKAGTFVIFSVPTFDDPAHVRYFKTAWSVYSRYYSFFELLIIVLLNDLFVCHGFRTDKRPVGLGKLLKTHDRVTLSNFPRLAARRVLKRAVRR